MVKYSDEFLLSELRRFYEENGRSPTAPDMRIKNGYPPATAYYKYFGSFTNALIRADLQVNHLTGYTNDQLIYILQKFYNDTGKSPTREDINNLENCPSYRVFVDRFGSFNDALSTAGLQLNQRRNVNKEYLISELHRFVSLYNRSPTIDDFRYNTDFPSDSTYQRHFGSWNNGLVAAKLDLNFGNKYTKEFLLNELSRFTLENNRVPEYRDLLPTCGYPTARTYADNFGSFNTALIEIGLTPNRIIHEYDGTETCYICHSNTTYKKWNYDKYDNRICDKCNTKIWFANNLEKLKLYKYMQDTKHRGYGVNNLNIPFAGSAGHHLWLHDDKTLVIHLPEFLHQLHWHSHHKLETMNTPNALALDYWINEEQYKELYLTGDVSGT